jgi:type II secretory pathway pseudopilin PulG
LTRSRTTSSERGFTLAGLIVILTVIAIFAAYTVPRRWSTAIQRDRERQTIFIMKQYAYAIREWQRAHGGLPVSLDQLKEARSPRLIRGPQAEWVDPLTGKVDWILIPPQTGQVGASFVPGSDPSRNPNPQNRNYPTPGTPPSTSTNPATSNAPNTPKDYKGPFVGVRPNASGDAYLALNGADKYENWIYTLQDLTNELAARNAAMQLWK